MHLAISNRLFGQGHCPFHLKDLKALDETPLPFSVVGKGYNVILIS